MVMEWTSLEKLNVDKSRIEDDWTWLTIVDYHSNLCIVYTLAPYLMRI